MDKEKFLNFVKTYREIFALIGLLVLCYFLYFFSMGNYSLIDVDETRYVTMSRNMFYTKDYLTLFLNGDFFFEKPPLYFWLETCQRSYSPYPCCPDSYIWCVPYVFSRKEDLFKKIRNYLCIDSGYMF